MEPLQEQEAGKLPGFRVITDDEQLAALRRHLINESASFAFNLFHLAQSVADSNYPYYIAIVEGGNHASQGFELHGPGGEIQRLDRAPFIKLDQKAESFQTTLLHETGHMIFSVLSGGNGIHTQQIAPMFHTTAAITDRGTAFNEGFAEHLEAVMAHFTSDRSLRNFYQHRRMTDDAGSAVQSGFLFPISDLSNYAQNFARYQSVRDNYYSFEHACTVPDYYRIQLSPNRNFERLRNPSQLVASEGFCASFFFWLVADQLETLSTRQTEAVYRPIFEGLERILNAPQGIDLRAEVPAYLTAFVKHYGDQDAKLRRRALRILYNLSHGAFFEEDCQERWTKAVTLSYRLDIENLRALHQEIAASERKVVEACLANVGLVDRRVGKVIAAVVPGVEVQLPVALGNRSLPLSFDINTVQTQILALIPGVSPEEIAGFHRHRRNRPFADFDDFKRRSGLRAESLKQFEPLMLGE
jgi:hypothetical protein